MNLGSAIRFQNLGVTNCLYACDQIHLLTDCFEAQIATQPAQQILRNEFFKNIYINDNLN